MVIPVEKEYEWEEILCKKRHECESNRNRIVDSPAVVRWKRNQA